jgi:hypothetical protein
MYNPAAETASFQPRLQKFPHYDGRNSFAAGY